MSVEVLVRLNGCTGVGKTGWDNDDGRLAGWMGEGGAGGMWVFVRLH